MYLEKFIRNKSTTNQLQEVILNYVILFHEENRNYYSIKNIDIQNFIKEVLSNFSIIYSLVNLYRSELDIKTNITLEIKNIVLNLSQNEYNLKDELQRISILKQTNLLIDLIRKSFDPTTVKTYKCVVPGCDHTAISSHTISRANNFTKGVDFYRLREKKFIDNESVNYQLMKVSDKKASAYPLFCGYHDKNIFTY